MASKRMRQVRYGVAEPCSRAGYATFPRTAIRQGRLLAKDGYSPRTEIMSGQAAVMRSFFLSMGLHGLRARRG